MDVLERQETWDQLAEKPPCGRTETEAEDGTVALPTGNTRILADGPAERKQAHISIPLSTKIYIDPSGTSLSGA